MPIISNDEELVNVVNAKINDIITESDALGNQMEDTLRLIRKMQAFQRCIAKKNYSAALRLVIHYRNVLDVVKYLVEAGADLNYELSLIYVTTRLHDVIDIHEYEIARYLVEKGANVMAVDAYGNTPLHIMMGNPPRVPEIISKDDYIEMVELLSDAMGIKNKNGQTPLDSSRGLHFLPLIRFKQYIETDAKNNPRPGP